PPLIVASSDRLGCTGRRCRRAASASAECPPLRCPGATLPTRAPTRRRSPLTEVPHDGGRLSRRRCIAWRWMTGGVRRNHARPAHCSLLCPLPLGPEQSWGEERPSCDQGVPRLPHSLWRACWQACRGTRAPSLR